MTKPNLLSAALIWVAALLATPAMARQGQPSSHRFTTIARSAETQIHLDGGIGDLPGRAERDAWGHWGAYYGPMVHTH
jgi:hypothetical protein